MIKFASAYINEERMREHAHPRKGNLNSTWQSRSLTSHMRTRQPRTWSLLCVASEKASAANSGRKWLLLRPSSNRQKPARRPGRMLKRKPKPRLGGTVDTIARQIAEAQRKRQEVTPKHTDRSPLQPPCLRRRQKKSRSRAAVLLENSGDSSVLLQLDFAECSDSDPGDVEDAVCAADVALDPFEDQENRTPPSVAKRRAPASSRKSIASAAKRLKSTVLPAPEVLEAGSTFRAAKERAVGTDVRVSCAVSSSQREINGKRSPLDAVTVAKMHMAAASSSTPHAALGRSDQVPSPRDVKACKKKAKQSKSRARSTSTTSSDGEGCTSPPML